MLLDQICSAYSGKVGLENIVIWWRADIAKVKRTANFIIQSFSAEEHMYTSKLKGVQQPLAIHL